MSEEYLSQTPVNGNKIVEKGALAGCKLTFDMLCSELKVKGVMKEGEVFSQVNVCEDSIVFYFKDVEG